MLGDTIGVVAVEDERGRPPPCLAGVIDLQLLPVDTGEISPLKEFLDRFVQLGRADTL